VRINEPVNTIVRALPTELLSLLKRTGGTRTHDPVLPKQEVTDSTASQMIFYCYIEAENKGKRYVVSSF